MLLTFTPEYQNIQISINMSLVFFVSICQFIVNLCNYSYCFMCLLKTIKNIKTTVIHYLLQKKLQLASIFFLPHAARNTKKVADFCPGSSTQNNPYSESCELSTIRPWIKPKLPVILYQSIYNTKKIISPIKLELDHTQTRPRVQAQTRTRVRARARARAQVQAWLRVRAQILEVNPSTRFSKSSISSTQVKSPALVKTYSMK